MVGEALSLYYIINQAPDDFLNEDEQFNGWLKAFVQAYGEFLDSPASVKHLDTFTSLPNYNVDDYFVVPRILAMIVSQMSLALYFSVIMVLCAVYFSGFIYDFSAQESLRELLHTVSIGGVMIFMAKNFIFGLVVGAIACFHGLSVKNSPTQVPQQMQKAAVRSLTFLFLTDGYFLLL